jgi:hypothetical protein
VDKPVVAVWNKTVRTETSNKSRLKIGPLDQDLIREDNNSMLDSADEKEVSDVVVTRTQLTDKADLSKLKHMNR